MRFTVGRSREIEAPFSILGMLARILGRPLGRATERTATKKTAISIKGTP